MRKIRGTYDYQLAVERDQYRTTQKEAISMCNRPARAAPEETDEKAWSTPRMRKV